MNGIPHNCVGVLCHAGWARKVGRRGDVGSHKVCGDVLSRRVCIDVWDSALLYYINVGPSCVPRGHAESIRGDVWGLWTPAQSYVFKSLEGDL